MLLHRAGPGPARFPFASICLSALLHVLALAIAAAAVMWTDWTPTKTYVVNLEPAIAAIGVPSAPPAPTPPVRTPTPAPTPPARTTTPEPTPREPAAPREPARLPEPTFSTPRLPSRTATATTPKPGEKELPPLSSPRVTSALPPMTRPTPIDKPVESRPAPSATLGQPTGSVAGTGALTATGSDFPYAWYLRQVLQKVQGEWQRQNRMNEPPQKPMVVVEIQRDGKILQPQIEQTSGNAMYDQAALRAIADASPFPPLPQDWSKPSLRVMFRFDLLKDRG